MLTNLSFQNFKSWKDTGDIRFAQITGLFGTNSSGKTAISQLLLMLKQTVESSDRQRILHLGDEHTYVDLGTSYDIIHQHQVPGYLSYSLSWSTRRRFAFPERMGNQTRFTRFSGPITFNAVVEFDSDNTDIIEFSYFFENPERKAHIGMRRQEIKDYISKYELFWEGLELRRSYGLLPDQRILEAALSPMKSYGSSRPEFASSLILEFETLFQNIYYLGPLREYPKRIYAWSGERPQDVGRRGELAVPALLSSQARSRKQNQEERSVEEHVAFWLRELGLIHDFRLQAIAENRREYEIRVRRTPTGAEVPITDVGFGVSQILPVLTLCYYVPENSTIILEQPEIHLHPSVQAGLADVFIDAIKTRNIQIILESHSEHLLRRLQRRIAEEKQEIKNTDAAIYFCEMADSGTSIIKPLDLDEFGNINNWPEGFFGDEMGDLVAMTEAAIRRQQRGN
ncbi:DUF3696 domain-containing protein [Phormidium sp. FACHB-592]|uniref:DUF3696 domain-containing protein n=1 Tax=Stenomitos frigidus AS-A4 TaxID=2933935 RepID=A0ABV0KS20_9CYAN|nr:DUF3696 domain-containing protein [Phormidium sp. FACHB-592]MBD2075496.1 DUF3696 domain-containing protein [Phormidium sp. FACHB-592]